MIGILCSLVGLLPLWGLLWHHWNDRNAVLTGWATEACYVLCVYWHNWDRSLSNKEELEVLHLSWMASWNLWVHRLQGMAGGCSFSSSVRGNSSPEGLSHLATCVVWLVFMVTQYGHWLEFQSFRLVGSMEQLFAIPHVVLLLLCCWVW